MCVIFASFHQGKEDIESAFFLSLSFPEAQSEPLPLPSVILM
jgi:hypothetical protein